MAIHLEDTDWLAEPQTVRISPDMLAEVLAAAAAKQANMAKRNTEEFIRHTKKKYHLAAAITLEHYAFEPAQVIPITDNSTLSEDYDRVVDLAIAFGLDLRDGVDANRAEEAWRSLPEHIRELFVVRQQEVEAEEEKTDDQP